MADGSGMLGILGENQVPQGTLDELRQAGIDPAKVGCCAPRSSGVRGCFAEEECIFGQPRYGGFKGTGPRNIGYYKREIDGSQKEDVIPCHGFIRSLARRMRAGEALRDQGKAYEQIRVIAQEGEWIETNPIIQVDLTDKKPTAELKRNPHRIQVKRHPRPGDNPQVTYEQRIWAQEQVRRRYDPEFQSAPSLAHESDTDNDSLELMTSGPEVPAPAAKPGVVAEPVAKPAKA